MGVVGHFEPGGCNDAALEQKARWILTPRCCRHRLWCLHKSVAWLVKKADSVRPILFGPQSPSGTCRILQTEVVHRRNCWVWEIPDSSANQVPGRERQFLLSLMHAMHTAWISSRFSRVPKMNQMITVPSVPSARRCQVCCFLLSHDD